MSSWNDPYLQELFLKKTPLIDVRAPVEFKEGSLPYSINLPIMNDEERHLIGTCYKTHGQEAAIKLGHELVSGSIKEERITSWVNFLSQNPTAEVFCFRGGMRSQISCQWIQDKGIKRSPIQGGYKRMRHFFLSWLREAPRSPYFRLGGPTGSGKTNLLKKITNHIDLEGLANHRGSTFGYQGPQPSQITFENHLACELMKLHEKSIVMEDESVTIGKLVIPRLFFSELRCAPLILLRVSLEKRIENIFNDYVKDSSKEFFLAGLSRIQRKLGGANYKILVQEIDKAYASGMELTHHENWISLILKLYYDPLYQRDIDRQSDNILFVGNENEVLDFLTKKSV